MGITRKYNNSNTRLGLNSPTALPDHILTALISCAKLLTQFAELRKRDHLLGISSLFVCYLFQSTLNRFSFLLSKLLTNF